MESSKPNSSPRRALLVSEQGPLVDAIGAGLFEAGVECSFLGAEELAAVGDLPAKVDILVLVSVANSTPWKEALAPSMACEGFGRIIHVANRSTGPDLSESKPSRVTENSVLWAVLDGAKNEDPDGSELLHRTALGRPVTLEEIASAVVFLASKQAGYMTGVHLPVTGGFGLGLFPEQLT